MLQSCSQSLKAPRSRRCIIVHLSKSACSMFLLSRNRLVAARIALLCAWLPQKGRTVFKDESGCAD